MNIFSSVKQPSLAISGGILCVLAISGTAVGYAVYNNHESQKDQSIVATAPKVNKTSMDNQPVTPQPAPENIVLEATPLPAPTPPEIDQSKEVPAIKSSQEYGEQYLDLKSNSLYQMCFDKMLNLFPAYFTPEKRESSIKALRVFTSVCTTNILDESKWKVHFGNDGSKFFDSDFAKNYANMP